VDEVDNRVDPELQEALQRTICRREIPHTRGRVDPMPRNTVPNATEPKLGKQIQIAAPTRIVFGQLVLVECSAGSGRRGRDKRVLDPSEPMERVRFEKTTGWSALAMHGRS